MGWGRCSMQRKHPSQGMRTWCGPRCASREAATVDPSLECKRKSTWLHWEHPGSIHSLLSTCGHPYAARPAPDGRLIPCLGALAGGHRPVPFELLSDVGQGSPVLVAKLHTFWHVFGGCFPTWLLLVCHALSRLDALRVALGRSAAYRRRRSNYQLSWSPNVATFGVSIGGSDSHRSQLCFTLQTAFFSDMASRW